MDVARSALPATSALARSLRDEPKTYRSLREPEPGDWVGIVANPASGIGMGKRAVERLAAALERRGLTARIGWTLEERASIVAESRVDPTCRAVVAAGGDGTVSGLINERPGAPICVLKAGTENLFAGHFGFRRRAESLAETIYQGKVMPLDLGVAGGRLFSLMAGFGFDADVVTRHHKARVRTGRVRPTNRAAYVEPVLVSSFTYPFPPIRATIEAGDAQGIDEAETLVGTTAFLFNLPRYALGLPFAPSALGDDGWLDLVVFRDAGALRALHYLWLVLWRQHLNRPDVQHRRVRKVAISAEAVVPVQLDGDPGGLVASAGLASPWIIEAVPHAIEVVVPTSYIRTHRKQLESQ